MARPKGQRGSWFALWKGDALPCVHEVYFHQEADGSARYVDQYVDARPKWASFIASIRDQRKVILTADRLEDGIPRKRKGYLSLWRVDNVVLDGTVLSFDFIERLPDRFT